MEDAREVGKCSKCGGEFEQGLIPDRGEGFFKQPLQWAEAITWLSFGAKKAINVVSYRCKNCGYLENYAK